MIARDARGRRRHHWQNGLGGLGDATVQDTLAAIQAGTDYNTAQLAATVKALALEQQVRPNPYTDFEGGMLRGWFRQVAEDGSTTNWPAPYGPGTIDPPPSPQEWAQFDATARKLGVGGWWASVVKHRTSPSSNFLDETGRSLATAVQQLDTYVPGWATIVDVIGPLVPVLPVLTALLAAATSLAPAVVGAVLGQAAGAISGAALTLGSPSAADVVSRVTSSLSSEISAAAAGAAHSAVVTSQTIAPVAATLAKGLTTFEQTNGTLVQQLEATAVEVAQGVKLALTVAAAVVTAGAYAGVASIETLLTGIEQTLGSAATLADAETAGQVAAQTALAAGQSAEAAAQAGATATAVALSQAGIVSTTLSTASTLASALVATIQIPRVIAATQALRDAARQTTVTAAQEAAAIDAETNAILAQIAQLEAATAALRARASGAVAVATSGSLPAAVAGMSTGAKVAAVLALAFLAGEVLG